MMGRGAGLMMALLHPQQAEWAAACACAWTWSLAPVPLQPPLPLMPRPLWPPPLLLLPLWPPLLRPPSLPSLQGWAARPCT